MHLGIILALAASSTVIAESQGETFARTVTSRAPVKRCPFVKFALSGKPKLYVARYTSLRSRFSMGEHSQLASVVSVGADLTGPPVTLILVSSTGTIWDFRSFPLRRLAGVIVLGGNERAVANVPDRIPVSLNAAVGPNGECFDPRSLDQENMRLSTGAARQLLGDTVYDVVGDHDPAAINIDGGRPPRPAPDRLRTRDIRASEALTREVSPGIDGILELLKTGAIRYATPADVDAWLAVRRKAGLKAYPLNNSSTFVINRATKIPQRDVYLPSFIVPVHIPLPKADNRYFSMKDGTCKGC